ncbi:hypothetical protein QM565_09020 [Geitlerinema splendidum]|nr:hypothetical protein [Geitlerinema splendidum]
MAKKFKTLIFSMTFLTCSAFSAHAMLSEGEGHELNVPTRSISPTVDPGEEEKAHAFFSRYPFLEALRNKYILKLKEGLSSSMNTVFPI